MDFLEAARWRIRVTNTGRQVLRDAVVTDPNAPACDRDSGALADLSRLNPGESVTWTCATPDALVAYTNTANVTATATAGPDPSDSDPAAITLPVLAPQIRVEKATNTVDADSAPGVYVPTGSVVTWTYVVTNPGNIELANVGVTDDAGTPADPSDDFAAAYNSGDVDGDGYLDENETWTFTRNGTSTSGPYSNLAMVSGTPVVPGSASITDQDPSNYYGFDSPAIRIEKATNAADPLNPTVADDADGGWTKIITKGDPVVWTYLVTTDGSNAPISNVIVTDNAGTGVLTDDFSPAYVSGDDGDSILEPGEVWLYQATAPAVGRIYTNSVLVTGEGPTARDRSGTPANPEAVSDTDLSAYFGYGPELVIEKSTNGVDADAAPGPYVPAGDAVTWTYAVSNAGNIDLSNVTVTDDRVAAADINCGNGNNVVASAELRSPARHRGQP